MTTPEQPAPDEAIVPAPQADIHRDAEGNILDNNGQVLNRVSQSRVNVLKDMEEYRNEEREKANRYGAQGIAVTKVAHKIGSFGASSPITQKAIDEVYNNYAVERDKALDNQAQWARRQEDQKREGQEYLNANREAYEQAALEAAQKAGYTTSFGQPESTAPQETKN